MLPIGNNVPVPPIVSPPPNTPSKLEALKQSAISTITAAGSMAQRALEYSISSDNERSRSQSTGKEENANDD
eukprot:4177471-Karenia_brevis.AAC.1